jgi:hypothetical protein
VQAAEAGYNLGIDGAAIEPEAPQQEPSPMRVAALENEPNLNLGLPALASTRSLQVRSTRTSNFTVTIDKTAGNTLGITVCWADEEALMIVAVGTPSTSIFIDERGKFLLPQTGLVHNWNAKHSDDCKVKLGDRIISVNGKVAGLLELKDLLFNASGKITFEIKPKLQFTVSISKGNSAKPLGLNVTNKIFDGALLVRDVIQGTIISDWNEAHEDECIIPGDRICAIHGKIGPGSMLRTWVSECRGELVLTVIRFQKAEEIYDAASRGVL